MSSYVLEIEENQGGDLFVVFPDELMEELRWLDGDLLEWNVKGNGIVLHKLNDSAGYEVNED